LSNTIKVGSPARSFDEIHYIIQTMGEESNILSVNRSDKGAMQPLYYVMGYSIAFVLQILKLPGFRFHIFIVVKEVNQHFRGSNQIARLLFEQAVEPHISRD